MYVIYLIGGFSFFYNSIETLYYRHFGLSFQQIAILISSSLLTSMVLDIPTGAFADLYGRKKSVIVASFFNFLAISLLLLGSSFPWFLIGFSLWGVGLAFNSGVEQALLYELLAKIGKSELFTRHMGRMSAIFFSVDIISGTLGPLMFMLHIRLPYLISWSALIIVLLLELGLYEEVPKRPNPDRNILRQHLNQMLASYKEASTSGVFVWLTLFGLLFYATNRVVSETISLPFLIGIGYSLQNLAAIGFIGNVISFPFTFFTDKIEERLGDKTSFASLVLGVPIIVVLFSLSRSVVLTGLLIGLYFGLITFREVLTQSYLNRHVSSENWATMLSISSMATNCATILLLPMFGSFADKTSTSATLWLISGTIVTVGILLLFTIPGKGASHSLN